MICLSNDIAKMNDRQLRNEVQLLRDEIALMKRKFEDIIYNLDTDNFSSRFTKEQGDMRAAIEFTAEGIKSKVSKEDLDAYSTKIQTAEQIQNIVSKGAKLDEAISITSIDKATDTSKIYVIKETDDSDNILSETYYYFNDITKTWEVLSGDSIYTVFNQTAEGFELKGNVKVDGSCILTDTLTFDSEDRPLNVQYSPDGVNDWHDTFYSDEDYFMRIKIGGEWSNAIKIVGTDGQEGPQGPPGDSADVTFTKVNSVLGYLYKTKNGNVPTTVTGSYIYSPNVLGGTFLGSEFYAGEGSGYSKMDEDGFNIYDSNGDNKLGIGYRNFGTTYPHITLGVGAGYVADGSGLIYKLGNGLWIGDSSVLILGGDYPGGKSSVADISAVIPYATGIFIDFYYDKIYQYKNGVPTEIGSGGSGGGGTVVAVFG